MVKRILLAFGAGTCAQPEQLPGRASIVNITIAGTFPESASAGPLLVAWGHDC